MKTNVTFSTNHHLLKKTVVLMAVAPNTL